MSDFERTGFSVGIQAELDAFEEHMLKAGRIVETTAAGMDKSTKRAATQFNRLEASLDPVMRATQRYERDVTKVTLALEKGATSQARAEQVLKNLRKQHERTTTTLGESARAALKLASDVEASAGAVRRLQHSLDPAAAALHRYEAQQKTLNTAVSLGTLTEQRAARLLAQSKVEYDKATGALKRHTSAVKIASAANSQFANSTRYARRSNRRTSVGFQQAGYQVADFSVQLAGGQNAILAFTQQGTQLLQVFGPMGSVIGAAAAVLGGIAVGLMASSDAAAEAELRTVALKEAQELLNGGMAEGVESLSELTTKYNALSESMANVERISLQSQIDKRKEEIASLKDLSKEKLTILEGQKALLELRKNSGEFGEDTPKVKIAKQSVAVLDKFEATGDIPELILNIDALIPNMERLGRAGKVAANELRDAREPLAAFSLKTEATGDEVKVLDARLAHLTGNDTPATLKTLAGSFREAGTSAKTATEKLADFAAQKARAAEFQTVLAAATGQSTDAIIAANTEEEVRAALISAKLIPVTSTYADVQDILRETTNKNIIAIDGSIRAERKAEEQVKATTKANREAAAQMVKDANELAAKNEAFKRHAEAMDKALAKTTRLADFNKLLVGATKEGAKAVFDLGTQQQIQTDLVNAGLIPATMELESMTLLLGSTTDDHIVKTVAMTEAQRDAEWQVLKLKEAQRKAAAEQAQQARDIEKNNQAWKRYQDQVDKVNFQPIKNAIKDVQSTLTDELEDALKGNIKTWEDWGDSVKNIAASTLANIGSQQIILPVVAAAGGSFGLSAQQMGLPTPPGASSSMSPLDALSAMGGAGSGFFKEAGASINAFGADWLGLSSGAPVPTSLGPGLTVANGGLTSAGEISAVTAGGTTLTSLLGGTAAGFGAGMFAGTMLGGDQGAVAAGSGAGALAGAIAGSVIPGVGTFFGALAGGLLGGGGAGLFTEADKDFPFGQVGFFDGAFQSDEVTALDGANTAELEAAARQITDTLDVASGALGIDLTGIRSSFGRASGRDGSSLGEGFYSVVGGPGGFNADPETVRQFGGDSEAAVADFFLRNLQAGLESAETDVSDEVATALGNMAVEAGDTIQDVIADIDFADSFVASIEAMNQGALDLTETIRGQVAAGIDAATTQIQEFKAKTEELGLDTEEAADATANYAAQLLGISEAADQESLLPVQTAWRQINATLEEAGPLLEETGLALEDLEKAAAGAQQELKDNFLADLQLGAAGLDGSLTNILGERDGLIDAAKELGVLGDAAGYIDQITDAALDDYLSGLTEAQLELIKTLTDDTAAIDAINDALNLTAVNAAHVTEAFNALSSIGTSAANALESALGGVRTTLLGLPTNDNSPLTAAEQIDYAKEAYASALAEFNRTGDGDDLTALNNAAQTYLNEAAEYFTTASAPYASIFGDVTGALTSAEATGAKQLTELQQLLGIEDESLTTLKDILAALQTGAANDNQALGRNPMVNALLASELGYAGDFGGGGFSSWIRKQHAGVQANAREIFTDYGQEHRIGFADGGLVTGGIPGRDSVPAMLMPGEEVISQPQVGPIVSAFEAGQIGGKTELVDVTRDGLGAVVDALAQLERRLARMEGQNEELITENEQLRREQRSAWKKVASS